MGFKKVLVVSDNEHILDFFIDLLDRRPELSEGRTFRFVCSPINDALKGKHIGPYDIEGYDIKRDYQQAIDAHDLVISAHCKQLFPAALTEAVPCVNVHPGLNPFNRGWYPQVFSILNGKPLGATIHVIDPEIDHGDIIDQKEVPLHSWDTSLTAYNRVQKAEEELMERSLAAILDNTFTTKKPTDEGNVNLKKDFNALCEVRLDEQVTFKQVIDRFRALTHGSFKNGYFYDPETGKKVFLKIELEPEADD